MKALLGIICSGLLVWNLQAAEHDKSEAEVTSQSRQTYHSNFEYCDMPMQTKNSEKNATHLKSDQVYLLKIRINKKGEFISDKQGECKMVLTGSDGEIHGLIRDYVGAKEDKYDLEHRTFFPRAMMGEERNTAKLLRDTYVSKDEDGSVPDSDGVLKPVLVPCAYQVTTKNVFKIYSCSKPNDPGSCQAIWYYQTDEGEIGRLNRDGKIFANYDAAQREYEERFEKRRLASQKVIPDGNKAKAEQKENNSNHDEREQSTLASTKSNPQNSGTESSDLQRESSTVERRSDESQKPRASRIARNRSQTTRQPQEDRSSEARKTDSDVVPEIESPRAPMLARKGATSHSLVCTKDPVTGEESCILLKASDEDLNHENILKDSKSSGK